MKTITKEDIDGTKGRYIKHMADGTDAVLTFLNAGENHIVIDHVGVPPQFRGGGVAAKLVLKASEDARASGTKITPLCPYAALWFKRHADWGDVLK